VKFLASIDPRDRRLLLFCLSAAIVLALLIGVLARNEENESNPTPSSYLTGKHGARAAFQLLQSSGYSIERWEQPLSELSVHADAGTVLILAQPLFVTPQDRKAIGDVLDRGGRVVATGFAGSSLLPEGEAEPSTQLPSDACKLIPQSLDELAGSGEVWMASTASWKVASPRYRVPYYCAAAPAVVEYSQGKGHVVWWASSTPLENGSISRGQNLEFFLNTLGPKEGHRFYWDESLHSEPPSEWYFARGPALNLLLIGLAALGLLGALSFSRRSGPVRELPLPERSAPVEYLEALGALYRKAGASSTAVDLAFERFCRKSGELCGQKGPGKSSRELAEMLRRRFPAADPGLEADLAACEQGAQNEILSARQALALVQALDRHYQSIQAAAGNASKNIGRTERARRAG
jgi:hypothetical protein